MSEETTTTIAVDENLAKVLQLLDSIIAELNASPIKNRQRNLAVTKLEEAAMWLKAAQDRETA
jgi:hypothetical protein